MNPNITAQAQQAYQQGQQMLNQYNSNVSKYTGEYDTAKTNADTAQQQLQDFTKNMTSGSDFYKQGLEQGSQYTGYDPAKLAQAQAQVSQLTGIFGGLPRAVQAQNANYGATASQVANQVATTGANLNQSLGLANQNASNQLGLQQNAIGLAQGYATSGIQGQQNQLSGYQAAAQNAATLMDQARQSMTGWATIAQNQGGLNAQQQQSYATAQQAYAAAQHAYAQAAQASAQTKLLQQQYQEQSDLESGKAHYDSTGNLSYAPVASTPVANSSKSSNNKMPTSSVNPYFSFNTSSGGNLLGSLSQDVTNGIQAVGNWFAGNPWNTDMVTRY